MATKVIDALLRVYILIASPCCLPAPLRPSAREITWEEQRLCCSLYLFVHIRSKLCSRCWLQIGKLKTGSKKETEGKPHKRRKAFQVKTKYFDENKAAEVRQKK